MTPRSNCAGEADAVGAPVAAWGKEAWAATRDQGAEPTPKEDSEQTAAPARRLKVWRHDCHGKACRRGGSMRARARSGPEALIRGGTIAAREARPPPVTA